MLRRLSTIAAAALATMFVGGLGAAFYAKNDLVLADPAFMGAVAIFGTALLFFGFLALRKRAAEVESRIRHLSELVAEREAFIATLEAANELNASEARYK